MKKFVCLAVILFSIGCGGRRSLDAKARRLMNLPVTATVISVRYGDWGGDYVVSFSMPTNLKTSVVLNAVWTTNLVRTATMPSGPVVISSNSISSRSGGSELREVRYLSEMGIYEYEEMLEK